MFERFTDAARDVMTVAGRESDRLHHNYIGSEHLLAAIAEQRESPAAQVLVAHRLGLRAVRAEIDHLITAGLLPPPSKNDTELLRTVGVDLDQVRRTLEQSFGLDAVNDAARRVSRRTGWTPLCGKALMVKQTFYFAAKQADALGQAHIAPEHLLLGVLLDARDPLDKPRCFRNPWQRRRRSHLGLQHRGPSPVRLVIEARGQRLSTLQDAILYQLHAVA